MDTKFNKEDDKLTVKLDGRLDTVTAPDLEEEVLTKLDGVNHLVFDFDKLEYISSAGLRLLLMLQKSMSSPDKSFEVVNANDFVMEVFEMTGFKDILNIS